jgi:hypothetical protein
MLSRFHIPCTHKSWTPSICEACQKGKHAHLPFHNLKIITYFPFQIIHCDPWTSPVESVTCIKYYLIMVDDYSRYIWTFTLRCKSDISTILRSFSRYVLNQFYLSIQSIQCDNVRSLTIMNFVRFYLPSALYFDCHVLTPLCKMARFSVPFALSMISCVLYCFRLISNRVIGFIFCTL